MFLLKIVLLLAINAAQCYTIEENASIVNTTTTTATIKSLYEHDVVSKQPLSSYETVFFTWFPWKRAKTYERIEIGNSTECRELSSIDEFPNDFFTKQQRQKGAFLLHVIGAIYFFTVCGLLIHNYFLPSIECFCEDLNITPDVAAAVFMATATAVPELCSNTISNFIADSDMGIGAVIGSLMWNVLGVAALASLATSKPVGMDWLPITRDTLIFAFNSLVFFVCVWDGKVYYWEAMIMLILIFVYYTIMFQNKRISDFVRRKIEKDYGCCKHLQNRDIEAKKSMEVYDAYDLKTTGLDDLPVKNTTDKELPSNPRKTLGISNPEKCNEESQSLWTLPKNQSKLKTFFWYYSWPIRFVLTLTIPNPVTWRRLYPITFILCIGWIAMVTYFIFWMMVVIAETYNIPESVMGLTVFAIGGCTPEMITSFIMARRGNSGVGVAHSLGAASLAILISLGLPWFLRTIINLKQGGVEYVVVHSNGMEYTALSLVGVVASLYICLSLSKFTLKKTTGFALIISYLVFITLAILVEVDVLFPNEDC